jgi:hypothetical protein
MVSEDSTSRVIVLPVTKSRGQSQIAKVARWRGNLRVLTKICMTAVDEDCNEDVRYFLKEF